ncbi:acyltransferase [Streptomyces sp. ME02-8801-2C]|uniref:acyltransferase family protein n=1 Tax=Streptomyces sp. ME02-8801-2C TaxID=3028680 RepID=UPI0029AFEFE0|nr:acyltransferase [Streptomyces sp. ME02-8801-2C]MDX3454956.1 acyltransferase [Streptomyces sp. ME02-8801-2C]
MNEERNGRPASDPNAEPGPRADGGLRLAPGRPRGVEAGRITDTIPLVRPATADRLPTLLVKRDPEPVPVPVPVVVVESSPSPAAPAGPPETGGRRFLAVDGLRGAAVLAVLLFDTGVGGPYVSWAGAGVGVDVLLVLTGFLTALPLLRRATATGRTGAVGFLVRRVKRLVPALLVAVAMAFMGFWALGSSRIVRDLIGEVGSVVAGRDGWAGWVHGRAVGVVPTMDSPLAPLWLWDVTARSVLAWSLLLAGLCLVARRRLAEVASVVALLAGAVTVAAAYGVLPGVGVVTGIQTLALPAGVAAACVVHLAERGGRTVSRRVGGLLLVAGPGAAAALVVSAVLLGGGHTGDRYVVAVVLGTAVLTAVLCGGRGPLVRLLSGDLLTEIGRMSYSLFLLHLPVYWLLRRGQSHGLGAVTLFLVGGAVTWFLSLLVHYLLVERLAAGPWRRGRVSR